MPESNTVRKSIKNYLNFAGEAAETQSIFYARCSGIILAFPISSDTRDTRSLFTWIPYFGCLFLDPGGVTDIQDPEHG